LTEIKAYDYIIAGMGCAGLSLAMQLSRSNLSFTKILLLDKALKNSNDRTWCFWNKENNNWYEPIVYKHWDQFQVLTPGFKKKYDLFPYQYKMIRGIDFYKYCLNELQKDTRFEFIQDDMQSVSTTGDMAVVKGKTANYEACLVFNSAFRSQKIKNNHINYVQHFMGWVVETTEECFDENCPVFMDFDTEQEGDFRFYYVIPYSKNKALIEYTGFSQNALRTEVYTQKLKDYLYKNHPGISYSVLESETGSIPMAESEFVNTLGKRVINIGTAGGYSKPSTGYTFYFIQKYTSSIVSQMEKGEKIPTGPIRKKRFLFYDKVMLDVLHQKKQEGRSVFTRLFQKNKIENLLDFLNEDSSFGTDFQITQSMNKRLFIPSAIRKLLGR